MVMHIWIFVLLMSTISVGNISQAQTINETEGSDEQLAAFLASFMRSTDWSDLSRTPAEVYGARILPLLLEALEKLEDEFRAGEELSGQSLRDGIRSIAQLGRLNANGDIDGSEYAQNTLFLLESPEPRVRAISALALVLIGSNEIMPVCFVLLEDEYLITQSRALSAIALYGNEDAIPALVVWRASWERRMAALDNDGERADARQLLIECDQAIQSIQERV